MTIHGALLAGLQAQFDHEAAAVSEGLCPRDGRRLQPVPSRARSAGRCLEHGYFWTGGPDVAFAETGWTSDPARVP